MNVQNHNAPLFYSPDLDNASSEQTLCVSVRILHETEDQHFLHERLSTCPNLVSAAFP